MYSHSCDAVTVSFTFLASMQRNTFNPAIEFHTG